MADRTGVLVNAGEVLSRHRNRRARLAVGLLYAFTSMPIGGWAARVPDVRRQVGADDVALGLANTVPSVGNVIGLCTIVLLVGGRRLAG